MTDLHCHLLPGIDDGAVDVDMSLDLLRQERNQGVTNIVFTSHFHPDHEDLHDFLKKRNTAFGTLMESVQQERSFSFSYKLGAEVYYSSALPEMDVESLCFTRSPYLLLEFSYTREPAFVEQVLTQLQNLGIVPIIAHIERYEWLKDRPDILHQWVSHGILLQANSGTLLEEGEDAKLVSRLIQCNLVGLLSSDAHHPKNRPADLGSGLMYVSRHLGEEKARELLQNGNRVFRGEAVIENEPVLPKRRFGKWY